MNGTTIFAPFLALMLLTFVVWLVMYVHRIRWITSNRIDAQEFTTPDKAQAIAPERVTYPSHNFRNLFELPVLFYALCLYLFATGSVDAIYVAAAWTFVALRAVHSAIHCTVNIVKARFGVYMAGALVLWFMIGRALVSAL